MNTIVLILSSEFSVKILKDIRYNEKCPPENRRPRDPLTVFTLYNVCIADKIMYI